MMYDLMANNKILLAGKVITEPEFYNESYDEKFFSFMLEIPRLSDTVDKVPVLISEKILENIEVGSYVKIEGQLRTYNKYEDNKRRLLIFAFVRDIATICYEDFKEIDVPNELTLTGFICKEPIYRTTPFGREITDILIAVNRAYSKSDYIPAIAWGRNAKFCKKVGIGQKVELIGRIQSRDYIKKIEDREEVKTAFEVSVSKIKPITEEID